MQKNKFYITTTLPYVNAEPHIGFALEVIQADVLARYHKLLKEDVIFNYGTDEHGVKVYNKAIEENKEPKKYCDEYAEKYFGLKELLNLSSTNFIRTTDEHHIKSAQEFWMKCFQNGDIYKKNYKTKYCNGCELEKTDSELENGRCPIHPNKEIEIREEINYFFKFSKYKSQLLKLYKQNPNFVIPQNRLKEISTFVSGNLQDFSISRLKNKMPWGIEVPNDPNHIMYVWFDALINYVSTLGWPNKNKYFSRFWPGIQIAGKDNLRQQSAMWQAMLISAGLPNSKQIIIHGFLTSNGQKISKSLGNMIDPYKLVYKYGTDAVRYFLLAKINPFEDSDFTYEKFENTYNSDLANGLGNLIARIAGMAQKAEYEYLKEKSDRKISKSITDSIDRFNIDKAIGYIWQEIKDADYFINQRGVWNLTGGQKKAALTHLIECVRQIAKDLEPFLPETSKKIKKQFSDKKIYNSSLLFPRLV